MRISDWSSDVCSSDRPYLEDALLQAHVAAFFDADKPVAAICHGVVLAARSISRRSGRSVLHGRRTTALTWSLERSAWNLTRFWEIGRAHVCTPVHTGHSYAVFSMHQKKTHHMTA